MSVVQFSMNIQFVQETCCNCGVVFAMTLDKYNGLKSNGGSFYCVNGHGQHYTRTKVQELEQELASIKSRKEWYQAQFNRSEKQRSALKGQITKIKNRVGNGVCPCCNRSFQNLSMHMKHKHPDFREKL